ncbi:MAG: Rrf2 family transcriptional regulator [Atopobiaceae bacterium]|jgi:Rrf2 family protein|nr:Rrf2 family transcriptional regulator [Atopobiaceae bacterium]MCI2174092.1 Rrf2 family transcriptional regulator [Atopobiaceae bacterium]MCI2206733.1 Rrf2 family transcriptional regulator [Atopobiaceae bacterium]
MNSDFAVAVHAVVYLAHRGCAQSSETLAENICTNRVRVRKVMAPLVRSGIVSAREGAEGGYELAADPDALTLLDVADALGTRFVSSTWHSGDVDCECVISSGMGPLLDAIYDDLDACCRERLSHMTVGALEREFSHAQEQGRHIDTAAAEKIIVR